jgi:hypothetical protein
MAPEARLKSAERRKMNDIRQEIVKNQGSVFSAFKPCQIIRSRMRNTHLVSKNGNIENFHPRLQLGVHMH